MAKKIKVHTQNTGPIYDVNGNEIATIPEKKPIYKKWWFWIIIVILLFSIISSCGGNKSDKQDTANSSNGQDVSTEETEEDDDVEIIKNNSKYTFEDLEVRKGDDGIWYAFAGDQVAKGYNGLAQNDNGLWFIRDGKVNFDEEMEYTSGDHMYLIEGGKVTEEYVLDGEQYKKVEKTEFHVGETFDSNGKSIKLVSANPDYKNYNRYADIPSGYKVLEVVFDFANNGETDFYYSSGELDCYADNEKCESFYLVNGGHASFLDTLSPGRTASNQKTYFLIPGDAKSVVLEYETNWWTENKIEFIVK